VQEKKKTMQRTEVANHSTTGSACIENSIGTLPVQLCRRNDNEIKQRVGKSQYEQCDQVDEYERLKSQNSLSAQDNGMHLATINQDRSDQFRDVALESKNHERRGCDSTRGVGVESERLRPRVSVNYLQPSSDHPWNDTTAYDRQHVLRPRYEMESRLTETLYHLPEGASEYQRTSRAAQRKSVQNISPL